MSWTSPFTVASHQYCHLRDVASEDPTLRPDGIRLCICEKPRLLLLHERLQIGHRLLHGARATSRPGAGTSCRLPKRSPTIFMPSISGPSITVQGARRNCCRASSVSLLDEVDDRRARVHARSAFLARCASRQVPGPVVKRARPPPFTVARRTSTSALGGVGPPVEDDVLDMFQQVRRDVLDTRLKLAGVHYAPCPGPRLDGVVEERGVDGFGAPCSLPRNENAQVADASAHHGPPGQAAFDLARRLDEGLIAYSLCSSRPGGDGQDVGVDDDVRRDRTRRARVSQQ